METMNRFLQDTDEVPTESPSSIVEEFTGSNDTSIIRETFRVYGSIYAFFFLLFCFLRWKAPKLYNVRSWVPEIRCGLAQAQTYGFFSWSWQVFNVPDDDMLDACGMDALCFLRCLRFGSKLCLLGSFNAIWLIPLYLTAEESEETIQLEDTFVKMSIANLPNKSARFIGTVISAYIIVLASMYLITKEYDWYTEYRHKYLAKREPRNYSIYVSGIPKEYQSSYKLADYFRQCISWNDSVLEAHIAMDIPALEAKVAKREKLVAKIEHIMAIEKRRGFTKTHRTINYSEGVRKVETVSTYMQELDKLNHQISLTSGHVTRSNHRMRQHLVRSDEELANLPSDSSFIERPGEKGSILRSQSSPTVATEGSSGTHLETLDEEAPPGLSDRYRDEDLEAPSSSEPQSPTKNSQGEKTKYNSPRRKVWRPKVSFGSSSNNSSNGNEEGVEIGQTHSSDSLDSNGSPTNSPSRRSWNVAGTIGNGVKRVGTGTRAAGAEAYSTVRRVGQVGAQSVLAAGSIGVTGVRRAADFGFQGLQQANEIGASITGAVVPLRLGRADGVPREAGFVVFKDLYSSQAARQMLQHPDSIFMHVESAPDPDEVFWRNVGLPADARRSGWLISLTATSVLCLFWSIPMAFLSSLTEVNSLKENLPTVAKWIEKFPTLETFLALAAPLLLLMLNEGLLPIILKWFATWEGHVGASVLEASLFVKLCAFVVIQTFFISAISGTITAELTNILDNPEEVVNLLANSLPAQSSYFIQICLVFTFLLQGLDLIRAYPLTLAFFRRFVFGPKLTEKERRKKWRFFNSLEDPPEFWHAEILAQIMLFFVVFFVYSSIAPITSVFLLACFVICESGYRYHFIHNQKSTPDSGGELYKGFIAVMMASMLIGQCTLYGLLILKKTAYALPALAPLGVLTILFLTLNIPARNRVAKNLPTLLCVESDNIYGDKTSNGRNSYKFVKGKYLQPALRAEPLYPQPENDGDVNDNE